MADTCTFDRRGNCFGGSGLYNTPSSNPNAYRMKPKLRARTFENVTPAQRRNLINWCWGIYTNIANVRGAIHFKTDFACSDACEVQYNGTNKAWGDAMMKHLNGSYYANCNLAGENHDFHTTLAEVSIALETHGQVGWVFDGDDAATGYKGSGKIKIISASSIGNGMSPDSKSGQIYELGKADESLSYWGLANVTSGGFANCLLIEKGPFAGNFLIDGIIVNRSMLTLGYRLIGFDADGKSSYADLPVGKMNLLFEPKFTDQIMGYPGLSGIVESVGTVDDWNFYIGQAMKLSAAFAVTRKTKDGKAPATSGVGFTYRSADGSVGTTVPGEAIPAGSRAVQAYEVVGSGLVELATDNNEEIGHVPFTRPSMNEEAFIERVETGFFSDLWPRAFTYSAGAGRASARITVVQAKQIVWKRHKTLVRFGLQWLRRKVAHAMSNGEIPVNNNLFDPYLFGLSSPAEISVDEGNDAKIDLAMLGWGATSTKVICAKAGHNEEQIDEDNFGTLARRLKKAKLQFGSEDNHDEKGEPILSIKEILQRICNGGNANQQLDLNPAVDEAMSVAATAPNPPPGAGKPAKAGGGQCR